MKRVVFLTGAGMSAESGISTFRDSGGLWENHSVEDVASHSGWLRNPELVNQFYNDRRKQLLEVYPNRGHQLIADMDKLFDVQVITQNVDNLHERAGSRCVLHLHGELMKVTSSRNPDDTRCIRELTADDCEVHSGDLAADGSLLRPYIVFFEEAVPNISIAAEWVSKADVFVVIGTSLNVYPAAGLLSYAPQGIPIYVIDPKPVKIPYGMNVNYIQATASEGMLQLLEEL